jgi:hypothetical protein
MEFRARLVHADAQRRVVRVRAFVAERCVGSALGEASSAEEAEDRARDRLCQRLRSPEGGAAVPIATAPGLDLAVVEEEGASPRRPTLPEVEPQEPREPVPDPEDWSADLTQLDHLLRSLGWGREQERIYVQRLFGHPSRSRLTRYADLMVLRRALESLPAGSRPETAPLPLLRADLLAQCDDLLARLGWTTERARHCLEGHFAVNSRQRLSDDQLLAFNVLLEGELLERSQPGGADGCLELPSAHSDPCSS